MSQPQPSSSRQLTAPNYQLLGLIPGHKNPHHPGYFLAIKVIKASTKEIFYSSLRIKGFKIYYQAQYYAYQKKMIAINLIDLAKGQIC